MTKTLEMWKVFASHIGKDSIVDYLLEISWSLLSI